ncbi:DegT/DnrJ/EryC1/StrS family aminotransferase [Ravibacter arvi]|uniref:DegT/DnrJ/EryC1/StrS family aminotransferase n=1 Tax=Ravibacter arvi TaxID=2051041 RepID=A0ABP8MAK5_9BACT
MINVTKSFLPDKEEYIGYINQIWDSVHLTNNGPLLQRLERELRDYTGAEHLYVCGNGTVVLEIALKALEVTGDVITTPFSYCATSNSIIWNNCVPVFVDIDPDTFNIDPELIEAAITPQTTAILATHVYGNPCDVDKIAAIAERHGLKVIYDAAHAFGVKYRGKSLFLNGDISTCSLHATKVFHSVEGGLIITSHPELDHNLQLLRAFGHKGDDHYFYAGINGKNSEFHAAMGLCNLPHVPSIIEYRRQVFSWYDNELDWDYFKKPRLADELEYNYSYYPIVFESEQALLHAQKELLAMGIGCRRYFHPSLNTLSFVPKFFSCPVSEDIAGRVLALPLFVGLEKPDVLRISTTLNRVVRPAVS